MSPSLVRFEPFLISRLYVITSTNQDDICLFYLMKIVNVGFTFRVCLQSSEHNYEERETGTVSKIFLFFGTNVKIFILIIIENSFRRLNHCNVDKSCLEWTISYHVRYEIYLNKLGNSMSSCSVNFKFIAFYQTKRVAARVSKK